jgi:DNA-binding response OmpR family regulator
VDNFVMRLRRHLEEDARSPRLLQTIRGVGYRLTEE